jgi:hypothetical protein
MKNIDEKRKLYQAAFLFLFTTVFLAGCVITQGEQAGAQLGEAIGKVLTGSTSNPKTTSTSASSASFGDPRRGIRSIGDSELAGLFNLKPLRLANGRNAQYPRVAITVDDYFSELRVPRPSECFFMHARIWDTASKFRDVASFSVCGKDIKEPVGGFLRADGTLNIWNSGIATVGEDHTGSSRTEGPRFPQRPVPNGPLDSIDISPSITTYFFVHGTMTTMNFDFSQADPRVWFVKFSKMDAAAFQAHQQSSQRPAKTEARDPVNRTLPPSPKTAVAQQSSDLDAESIIAEVQNADKTCMQGTPKLSIDGMKIGSAAERNQVQKDNGWKLDGIRGKNYLILSTKQKGKLIPFASYGPLTVNASAADFKILLKSKICMVDEN